MTVMEDVDEMLNVICFAPVPYEVRVEMCAAVIKAASEAAREKGAGNGEK